MEHYLTVRELSDWIKFAPQTIYNKISSGEFVEGKHFVKPSPKKVLFMLSAIHDWIGNHGGEGTEGKSEDCITENIIQIQPVKTPDNSSPKSKKSRSRSQRKQSAPKSAFNI